MTYGLEDSGLDAESLELIRKDIAEARKRLEQSVINYQFGKIMMSETRGVTDEMLIASMAGLLTSAFDVRKPGSRELPLTMAILLVEEMRRNDK